MSSLNDSDFIVKILSFQVHFKKIRTSKRKKDRNSVRSPLIKAIRWFFRHLWVGLVTYLTLVLSNIIALIANNGLSGLQNETSFFQALLLDQIYMFLVHYPNIIIPLFIFVLSIIIGGLIAQRDYRKEQEVKNQLKMEELVKASISPDIQTSLLLIKKLLDQGAITTPIENSNGHENQPIANQSMRIEDETNSS